jgi:hypothetical protein
MLIAAKKMPFSIPPLDFANANLQRRLLKIIEDWWRRELATAGS